MAKFYCADCDSYLDELEEYTDQSYHGAALTETRCPICHSGNVSDAVECSMCGAEFPTEDESKGAANIGYKGLSLCAECETKFQKKFTEFLEGLSRVEKDYLEENIWDFWRE